MTAADNSLFSRAYPEIKRCNLCGYPLTSEDSICSRCRDKEWAFNSSTSLYLYRGLGKKIITSFKFDNRRKIAGYIAHHIAEFHTSSFPDYTIVPIPFRPAARRKRGWDQIEIICKILKTQYAIPVSCCLRRINGKPQKTMSYKNRLSNLENRIHVKKNKLPPTKVLLLDDVFTTGATMDCCARILKQKGTGEIHCIAVAIDL